MINFIVECIKQKRKFILDNTCFIVRLFRETSTHLSILRITVYTMCSKNSEMVKYFENKSNFVETCY